jgi:hypothetical protein
MYTIPGGKKRDGHSGICAYLLDEARRPRMTRIAGRHLIRFEQGFDESIVPVGGEMICKRSLLQNSGFKRIYVWGFQTLE